MDIQIIQELAEIIADRKNNPDSKSYTTSLFIAGDNKIIKKLGEENAEYIRAFLKCDDTELAGEAADYIYHLMVSLAYRGVPFANVLDILRERHNK